MHEILNGFDALTHCFLASLIRHIHFIPFILPGRENKKRRDVGWKERRCSLNRFGIVVSAL